MSFGGGGYGRPGNYGGGDDRRYFEQQQRGGPPPPFNIRGGPPRGRQYDRGGEPPRDRSRSRGPPPGGSRRLDDQENYQVQTNYFKIKMDQHEGTCVEYRATIYEARQVKRGQHGEELNPPRYVYREKRGKDGTFIPHSRVEVTMEKGATQRTEDVMLALHQELKRQNPPMYIAVSIVNRVNVLLFCCALYATNVLNRRRCKD